VATRQHIQASNGIEVRPGGSRGARPSLPSDESWVDEKWSGVRARLCPFPGAFSFKLVAACSGADFPALREKDSACENHSDLKYETSNSVNVPVGCWRLRLHSAIVAMMLKAQLPLLAAAHSTAKGYWLSPACASAISHFSQPRDGYVQNTSPADVDILYFCCIDMTNRYTQAQILHLHCVCSKQRP
jgi:hypothetical protein